MGCCQASRDDFPSADLKRIKQFDAIKQFPLRFGVYSDEELKNGIDCQVVCITKPELSYVLHLESHQLLNWSLKNLEEHVIKDFTDHMIESFRLSQQRQIQKKYYNSNLLEFIDLLPLYIELSGDESVAWIEVEIEHSRSVLVLPYESQISLRELKIKISGRVDLSITQFELHFLERPLVLDDMLLSDCGISANSKLRLVQHDSQNDLSTIHTSEWEGKSCKIMKNDSKQIQEDDLDSMPELEKEDIQSNFSEISMIQYGNSGESYGKSLTESEINEKLTAGLSVQVQCINMACNHFELRQILPFALGEFIFSASNSSTPLNCAHCGQPVQPFQLLFFNCTYIVSGISVKNNQSKMDQNYQPQLKAQNFQQQDNNQILDPKHAITNQFQDLGGNIAIESSNLIKFNQGQLISTDGEALENFSLDCENSEWKKLRVRVRSYMKQTLVCGICTIPINPHREKHASLKCNHMYHANCLSRFQQKDTNSRCAFCVF